MKESVKELVVPVLQILQACVNKSNQVQGYNGLDAQTLEEVRNDWCSLVGETDTANEGSNVISEIIPMILLDHETSTNSMAEQQTSKNRDSVSQSMDMSLATRYKEVVSHLLKSNTKRLEP